MSSVRDSFPEQHHLSAPNGLREFICHLARNRSGRSEAQEYVLRILIDSGDDRGREILMFVERLQLVTLAARRQNILAWLQILEGEAAILLRKYADCCLFASQKYRCFLDRLAADRIHSSPGDTEMICIQ